ncbi:MAG: hypothetical protein WC631_00100 [Candidatus Paceibacterota bacterium]|jgi:hypothetical protein
MISIYTRTNNIFSKEYLKWLVRKIINKKSGPEAVLESLIRGLNKSQIDYEINPKIPKFESVHVLSGVKALKDTIKLKSNGVIKRIIAGPNLIISPNDQDGILLDKNIDTILVPSQWVADFYSQNMTKEQSAKISIWPAGTDIPISQDTPIIRDNILLFIKNVDLELANAVQNYLQTKKYKFEIIRYSNYKQAEYFSLLNKSKLMIYLQIVESQGIALQEAWAKNVPTLVLERKSYTYPDGKIAYGQISAPYLTNESGQFFKDFNDFKIKIEEMMKNLGSYSPRGYCQKSLSDEASTKRYLEIIRELRNSI